MEEAIEAGGTRRKEEAIRGGKNDKDMEEIIYDQREDEVEEWTE